MGDEPEESGLRVLLLEDSELDAELVLHHLTEGGLGCATERVVSRTDYTAALGRDGWDVILSDYSLPGFDGATALRLARDRCPGVPFIFVSGAIGEEVAIETLKAGATDYVLKHRLERLVPAVRRAIAEARERAECKRLEAELRRRAEELAEADRRKDEFLALLAHELRNPLAPLRNGLQILRLADADPDARARAREMMDRQLGHLVRIVDDLLDVSRITRGKMELRRTRVRLEDVVGSAVEAARPLIDAAGHTLEVSIPDRAVVLDADLTRLAQVFANLLTNSAKYTPAGGRIRLTAEARGGEVVATVRDTGIGIPAEALPRIFDMFSQVDRSIEKTTGGLGIGLALVRGLVEMHGGTVTAESPGPDRGSTFTVRLPVLDSRPAAPSTDEGVRGPGCRVLVVDDNRDGAESLAEMLRLLGNEVYTAHDGLEAVEAAGRLRPDLILMDVGMPRLNGLDATRRIREQPWGRAVAVIALTGWGQEIDRLLSREAGCDGHLVKPVGLAELQQLLAGRHVPGPGNEH
jgi:signal transduction histidine kinase